MDVTTPVGSSANFTCLGQGYGVVTVNWQRRKGGPMPDKAYNNEIVEPNLISSTLIIPNVSLNDSGRYRCRYSNGEGRRNNSRPATLTIGSECR